MNRNIVTLWCDYLENCIVVLQTGGTLDPEDVARDLERIRKEVAAHN